MADGRREIRDLSPDEREVLEFLRAHRRHASDEMIADCTVLSDGASVRGIIAGLRKRGLVDILRTITKQGRAALRETP